MKTVLIHQPNYIEVTLELKPYMQIAFNHWKCTINGEDRDVSSSTVRYHLMTFEGIEHTFVPGQIKKVTIEWHNG